MASIGLTAMIQVIVAATLKQFVMAMVSLWSLRAVAQYSLQQAVLRIGSKMIRAYSLDFGILFSVTAFMSHLVSTASLRPQRMGLIGPILGHLILSGASVSAMANL